MKKKQTGNDRPGKDYVVRSSFQLVPPVPSSAFKAEVTKNHLGALSMEYVHHGALASPLGKVLSGSEYNLYHCKADKRATSLHYKLALSVFFYTKL